jgi:hypothetical protein
MSAPRPLLGSGFFYTLIGGFFLAIFTMGIVGLGHCPGEPTSEVLACRAAQKRIGLVYPLAYLAVTGWAVLRYRRGLEGAKGLAIFAGPLGAVAVMLVNAFMR